MSKEFTEKQIEHSLVRGIKALGGIAYKFVSPGHAGVPDRILILPGGKVIFVELKRPGGKTTALQDMEITRLKFFGCDAGVVSTPEEVQELLRRCQRHCEVVE